jgi:hypothetical protein
MPAIETTGDAVPGWGRMPNESQKAVEAAREYFENGCQPFITESIEDAG